MIAHSILFTAISLAPAADSGYVQAIADVATLDQAINEGEPVRGELFDALAKLPSFAPMLAADPEARKIRTRAQLNIARTYLSEGATDSAAGVMDEVLRSTIGETLAVEQFGPSLAALHAERLAALAAAGMASIEVNCGVPCRVYIDERVSERSVDDLYLGMYRVWIEAEGDLGELEPRVEWVKLTQANERVRIEFQPQLAMSPNPAAAPTPRRIMSREAEIALLVVGSGVAIVGGVMLGQTDASGRSMRIAGATLTGLAGISVVAGGITLAIDEVRVSGARGHQATLAWRLRF